MGAAYVALEEELPDSIGITERAREALLPPRMKDFAFFLIIHSGS